MTAKLKGTMQPKKSNVFRGHTIKYLGLACTIFCTSFLFWAGIAQSSLLEPPILSLDPVSPTSILLTWSIPGANSEVTSYKVFRDGIQIATTTSPLYKSIGLSPDTNYEYTVTAHDSQGNASPTSLGTIAKTFYNYTSPDNLKLDLKLNNASGLFAYDSSPNSHLARLTGDPSWTIGKRDGAILLDGTNDRIQGIDPDSFEYTGGDMSISLWYWADASDEDGGYIISKPWSSNGTYNYKLLREPGNTLMLTLGGANNVYFNTPNKLRVNDWNHIAITLSSQREVKIYLNNKLEVSSLNSITDWTPVGGDGNRSFTLGCLYPYGDGWVGNTTYCVKGIMDNVKIYNDVLTQGEVNQTYIIENRTANEPAIFFSSSLNDGDTLSGDVTLTVETLGNVDEVQFKRGKINIGSKDTTRPYSVSWDTRNVSSGHYSLSANGSFGLGQTVSDTRNNLAIVNGDGVIIHIVPAISDQKILPNTTIFPGTPGDTLFAIAAKGEFEPVSFVVQTKLKSLSNVRVSVSNLQKGSDSISSSNIDLKSVKAWYQSGNEAWVNIRQTPGRIPNLVPELLLNDDSLVLVDRSSQTNSVKLINGTYVNVSDPTDSSLRYYTFNEFPVRDADLFQPITLLPLGESKQFWLTIHIPNETKSGVYTGTVTISYNGFPSRTLNLEVTVPPFSLLGSNIENTIYYTGRLDSQERISHTSKTETQYRAEMIDLKNHGILFPTMYQDQNSIYFRQELAIRQELGMSQGPLYSLGHSPDAHSSISLLEAEIPSQLNLIRSYGFTDYYLYGQDEASGDELTAQRASWNRARELGAKVFVAGYADAFDRVGDLLDTLIHARRKNSTYANQWHGIGHKIYSYGDPQAGAENPQLYRRNFGVVLWAAGYDGAMTFAYQSGFGRPWNDFDDPIYRDHNFTYPTMNGIVGTIAWEGYREANDDIRYISTLESAIAIAKTSTDVVQRDAGVEAQNYLNNLRTFVLSNIGIRQKTADFAIDLYKIRSEIVEHIEKINSTPTPPPSTTPVITVTQQPLPQTVAKGQPFSLSVNATTNIGTLSYQWQYSSSINGTYTNIAKAKPRPSLRKRLVASVLFSRNSAQLTDTGYYRVQVTTNSGSNTASVTSNAVLVTVTTAQPPPTPTPTSTPSTLPASALPYTFTRNLSLYMRGEDVRMLQIYLNTHEFLVNISGDGSPGKETTFFGSRTQFALSRFQATKGILPSVGYFGPKTIAFIGGISVPRTEASPANPTFPSTPSSTSIFTRNLSLGMSGNDVVKLKQFLISQGYLGSEYKTSFFGPLTKSGLARFQQAQGISPTSGYFGPVTRLRVETMLR